MNSSFIPYMRINLTFRECIPGEEITKSGDCVNCSDNYYSLVLPSGAF